MRPQGEEETADAGLLQQGWTNEVGSMSRAADDNADGNAARSAATCTNPNPNVLNPAVKYGGVDPENEDNVHVVESVSYEGLRRDAFTPNGKMPDFVPSSSQSAKASDASNIYSGPQQESNNGSAAILGLPSELIDTILGILNPFELATVSKVCHKLHDHAYADIHWHSHVLSNLPRNPITSPYPFKTFRELYISHDPYWFIPKHKLWFCDRELTGQLVIAQYDQRRGVIEGYQLLAIRRRDGSEPWDENGDVHIHYFEPDVKLHRDKPIIKLSPPSVVNLVRDASGSDASGFSERRRFFAEQPMLLGVGSDPRFSNVILTKPLTENLLRDTMDREFPYGYVWPPPDVPARHRVAGHATGIRGRVPHSARASSPSVWKPSSLAEASDQTFQVRQWMEMGPPTLGVHLGEELVTFSTLDPYFYTPTAEKPWRGIWVGDYSGHGCEFLLMHQPDRDGDADLEPLVRHENETEAEFQQRFLKDRVHQGGIEAIKLTGDPNVPRGEFTFVANDLGEDGLVGFAQQRPFAGARIVRSKGHIASMGFYHHKLIESQLILISHNRLAQYWVEFGHISYFERVDIDRFLVPA